MPNKPDETGRFPSAANRDAAIEALKNGESVESVAVRFGISSRTVFRYASKIPGYKYVPPPPPVQPPEPLLLSPPPQSQAPPEEENEDTDFENKEEEDMQQDLINLPKDPPSENPPAETPVATAGAMRLTEAGLNINITIPPVMLTMFDFAKSAGWEDEEEDLDTWLFNCVLKRYELDYKHELVVVPIQEGRGNGS